MHKTAKDLLQQTETLYAVGFKRFWRASVKSFFPRHEIQFVERAEDAPDSATILHWGANAPVGIKPEQTLIRLEDGFIRSVGLGAEFARPLSWVADYHGMYFDATQPSDLEYLIQQTELNPHQLEQARVLIERLTQEQVSKYNVGTQDTWQAKHQGKPIHLVVGQVETDASIQRGVIPEPNAITTNTELVETVKARFPEAHVVYKPHPDVVAKARAEGKEEYKAFELADEVVVEHAITELFAHIDALHCMTSLSGFEALLRNIPVHCYGMPFYAGWGLTHDTQGLTRRSRKINVETLVYCALVAYPRYVATTHADTESEEFMVVNQTLNTLNQQRLQAQSRRQKLHNFGKRQVRQVLNWLRGGAK